MYAGETIAAVATPLGQGGVGIVRVSGAHAATIAASVFSQSHPVEDWVSHRLYFGRIIDTDGAVLDEGLAVLMRAPHSYTGEEVLELHCHGSPVVLRRVLARVLRCGARLAQPGEFTKRAFLNGRLDLAQAEAVIDLVRARTDAGATLAAQQLSGRLSEHLAALRGQLVRLKALLETQIDFPEEDNEISDDETISMLDESIASINSLIHAYSHGRLIREGMRVAIIGKPNVGKSSLLNALLGEDRAIVTEIAGTTRDVIDEAASFEGVPVVLSDTAGLRESAPADVLERLGMERTTATITEAQMVLTVLDASQALDAQDHAVLKAADGMRQLLVLNKIDLPRCLGNAEVRGIANGHPAVAVSAKLGLGLDELRRAVITHVADAVCPEPDRPVLTSLRHRDALAKALASLQMARQSVTDDRPPDLVAVDVQDAIDHIGEVTGAVTNEEVLDRIFSEFCIGK